MGAVLALLPQTKEFVTEDGLAGTLTLKLDTVNVEVAGYGSATRSLTATRTYPGLADQDTQYIPKSISDNGRSLTLQTVNWQTEGNGHFTAPTRRRFRAQHCLKRRYSRCRLRERCGQSCRHSRSKFQRKEPATSPP